MSKKSRKDTTFSKIVKIRRRLVFFGTAHKPKSSEIELLPRVLDQLPPLVSVAASRKRDVEISLEKTCSTNFGFVGSSGTRNTL